MVDVCRTCLRIIQFQETSTPVDIYVRKQLQICFPELVAENVVDPVICSSCNDILQILFHFKTNMITSEKKIDKHLRKTRKGKIIPVGKLQMLTLGHYNPSNIIMNNAPVAKEVRIQTTPDQSENATTSGSKSLSFASSKPHSLGSCSGDSTTTCNWDYEIFRKPTPITDTINLITKDYEDDDVHGFPSLSNVPKVQATPVMSAEIVTTPTDLDDFSDDGIESDGTLEISSAETVGTVMQCTPRSESSHEVVENYLTNNSDQYTKNKLVQKTPEVTPSASAKAITSTEPQLLMEVEQVENTTTNEVQKTYKNISIQKRINYKADTDFVKKRRIIPKIKSRATHTSKKQKLEPSLSKKLSKSNEKLPNSEQKLEAVSSRPDHIDHSDNITSAKTDFIKTKPKTTVILERQMIGVTSSIEETKHTSLGLNREVEMKFQKSIKEPSGRGIRMQAVELTPIPEPNTTE